jgi:hypothetical protein
MDPITLRNAILPLPQTSPQGQGRGQGQLLPQLDQGQLLKALVVGAGREGRFLLEIGGNRLTASSQAPLSPGQLLQLQVVSTSPEIQLRIIGDSLNQFFGRSLTLLGSNIDLAGLFRALPPGQPPALESLSLASRTLLEGFFSLQQSALTGRDSGAILKQLINSIGLNFERLLAAGDKAGALQTLKAALLELAQTMRSAEGVAANAGRLLQSVEMMQLAQLQAANDAIFILPLPLPYIERGYLVVERDQEGKQEGDQAGEQRFSLHLTMAELGHLQIDFLQNDEGLFIRFHAEDQDKADFIGALTDELREAISGVQLVQLSVAADAGDPIATLLRRLVSQDGTMLNTRA